MWCGSEAPDLAARRAMSMNKETHGAGPQVEKERVSEANAQSAAPAGAPMPLGGNCSSPNGMAGPRGGPARFGAFGAERVRSTRYNDWVVGGGKLKTDLPLMLIDKLDPKRGSESRVQDIGEARLPFCRLSRLEECSVSTRLGPSTGDSFKSQTRRTPMPNEKTVPENPSSPFNPHAAGIDVGATEMYVAVPPGCTDKPVRCFGTFTEDLIALSEWLKSCGVTSVAMESTGVYWIPLFQILEDRGFEVCLVNARHVKNVPGRKTDVADCQWLQYLHSVGLLRGSFRPPQQVCAVRSVIRHRDALVKMASVHVQHMQKALNQMNLQLHHVIANIVGVTGLAIIDAILAGERDTTKLASFRDCRIKASETTIAKSLVGDYRVEHLFTLRQSLQTYRHYQGLIADCDQQVKALLSEFDSRIDPDQQPLSENLKRRLKKDPTATELRVEFHRLTGVDLTAIPGIQVNTVNTLMAEIGRDVSKFHSSKGFASWLGLCPDNRISGGRVLSVQTRAVKNRAATALRLAALSLYRSQTALGDFFRRMRAKLGTPKAITATAHKLARIIYYLLKTRSPYDQTRFARHEEQYRRRREINLKNQAKALGFSLVPVGVS